INSACDLLGTLYGVRTHSSPKMVKPRSEESYLEPTELIMILAEIVWREYIITRSKEEQGNNKFYLIYTQIDKTNNIDIILVASLMLEKTNNGLAPIWISSQEKKIYSIKFQIMNVVDVMALQYGRRYISLIRLISWQETHHLILRALPDYHEGLSSKKEMISLLTIIKFLRKVTYITNDLLEEELAHFSSQSDEALKNILKGWIVNMFLKDVDVKIHYIN
ncbi:hypothetical protein ACJX0J_004117, partial [Zea mays]